MDNLQNYHQFINKQAIEACRILQDAGHKAFIVGGCVRDLILGLTPKDWDITTSAKPVEVMLLFSETYPTGLQHGTVTVALGKGIENHFEVTTFRVEGKYLDGRRPEDVTFVNNVEEDLSRRDLTINAMAYDPISNQLIDPFGGQEDLNNHIIKAVGNAEERFREDGLRIMRAARFSARFGYEIDPSTLEGMKNSVDTLSLVSKERISDELSKIIMTNNMDLGLIALRDCGALNIACPVLTSKPLYFNFQNTYRGQLETRLAHLYSNFDIEQVKQELIDLKFSTKEIKKVIFLLEMRNKYDIFEAAAYNKDYKVRGPASKAAYIDFIAFTKNQSSDAWENSLEQFILMTEQVGIDSRQLLGDYANVIIYSRKEMNINGDDLLAIGVKPGPEIKRILNMCYEEILEEPNHNTKNILINFVQNNCLISIKSS